MGSTVDPGPIDKSVLYDQENHISSAIWEGQERSVLRCHEHTSMLEQWKLTPKQIELVEKAGFGYFRMIPTISLDNALISALVERWRRETNSFHLAVGEMTITLEDVALILGLPIDGKPVLGVTRPPGNMCENLLGEVPGDLTGGMLKLTWLKERFSTCPEDAPINEIERHTRAYLLYLVGCTIFSTTTGNKVSVMYLPLFKNFDEAGKFAWGAAALAFLYRSLGNASLKSQSTISGSLTLLQCWSYYRLNVGNPKFNKEPNDDFFPFALRWKGRATGPRSNSNIGTYRKALDSLQPSDVNWLPYKDLSFSPNLDDFSESLILQTSKTVLICFDKAERHLPDRCLRQFGMLQPIPKDVQQWERKIKWSNNGVDVTKQTNLQLKGKNQAELKEWIDRRLHIITDEENVDESMYMEWYERITRRFVGRPESLESEFQRIVTAMREIADIADSLSNGVMGFQDKQSLDEIKNTALNSLMDVVEDSKRSRRKIATKRKRDDDPSPNISKEVMLDVWMH
ncbi:protein MAIN-LIKE 2-like [Argentina anserina]|uniref:protein MAIN-LIKE 2-like n=1 Tax=Argentina anserina TaxID=57926 RepID=UPI0021765458|nr:protein MAIN-LIKE 2-like [Potentilla anserina]XP_050370588.1 protein MAIN-LIKE 2-like [Potentilla anserina]